MFELMNNQNLNPTDLHLGYQSLSQFNEHCEAIEAQVSDRDVVFIGGAETSGNLESHEESESKKKINIEQFNKDF